MNKQIIYVGVPCLIIGAAIAFGYSIQAAKEDNNKNIEVTVDMAPEGYRITEPGKDPVTYLVGDNQAPDVGNVSNGYSLEELNAMYEEQVKAREEKQSNNNNAEESALPNIDNTINNDTVRDVVENPCTCTCSQ